MKKLLVIIVVLSIASSFLIAQNRNLLWEVFFGSAVGGSERGHDMIQLADGSLVITGTVGEDTYLVKTDSNGILIWESVISVLLWDGVNAIDETTDGGFILCGYVGNTAGWDYTLVKTDANGIEEWRQTYVFGQYDKGFEVLEAADGGFLLYWDGYGQTRGLVKTDANGMLEWENDALAGYVFDMMRIASGYLLVGEINGDVWIWEIDEAGTEVASATIDSGETDEAYAVAPTADGGYIIAGSKKVGFDPKDIFVVKVDATYTEEWQFSANPVEYDNAEDVIQTADGNYLVVGIAGGYVDKDAYILKLDSVGTEVWHAIKGNEGEDTAIRVVEQANGNLVVMGYTQSYNGQDQDIWLMCGDETGFVGIDENITIPVTTMNLSAYPNPFNPSTTIMFSLDAPANNTVGD